MWLLSCFFADRLLLSFPLRCSYLDKVKLPSSGEEVAPGDEYALRIGHRAMSEISVKAIYESMCLVSDAKRSALRAAMLSVRADEARCFDCTWLGRT